MTDTGSGYDAQTKEAFIPDKEIMGEFENAMSVSGWPEVMKVLRELEKRGKKVS